jgi:hypothetical protein
MPVSVGVKRFFLSGDREGRISTKGTLLRNMIQCGGTEFTGLHGVTFLKAVFFATTPVYPQILQTMKMSTLAQVVALYTYRSIK